MRIYIGTDADTARRALEIGITPASRAHTGSHEDSAGPRESAAFLARSLTSDPAIELTTAYAPLNAVLAAGDEKPWGVVELDTDDLDPLRLAPESRWLATFLAGHHDANWMNVAGLWDTRDAERVRAHALLFRHLWRESVEAVGRCVYAGPIERVAIRRVAIFDSKSNDTIAYERGTTSRAIARSAAVRRR